MESLNNSKNGLEDTVASCSGLWTCFNAFNFAAEDFPCSAFQPLHTSAQLNWTLFTWMPQEVVALFFQTIPLCSSHEFMIPSTRKNIYPPGLTRRGWSILIKDLAQIAQWITYKHIISYRYLEFVAQSDWGIWCDGWLAFTLWDPRNQWKSVRMRKITSICHNLDRQAGRQGRQETQYVSQSTYTQTQRDLGAPLTCPITQTHSGKGTICAHMCEYLTYSTNPPKPPRSPPCCWNRGLLNDPDDHLYSVSSLIMCVSVFRVLLAHMETLVALDLLDWRYSMDKSRILCWIPLFYF